MRTLKSYEYLTDAELTDILVANISRRLLQYDWTLREFADKAGLPYETIKKIISGKIRRPSFYSIWLIANTLGCSLDELAENPQ